jgi:hypothetical protein
MHESDPKPARTELWTKWHWDRFSCQLSLHQCSILQPTLWASIGTRYGLDDPGIECRWGRDFTHLSRPALGPSQPPVQWVLGPFPEHKTAEAWR